MEFISKIKESPKEQKKSLPIYLSETSKIRQHIFNSPEFTFIFDKPDAGLDIGCAGDKLFKHMKGFDLPNPYSRCGDDRIDYRGDASKISSYFPEDHWKFIYSSHLLEDFPNTKEVLADWKKIVKPDGYIILYLPNEQRYRSHCKKTGQQYNGSHKVLDMSCEYMEKIGKEIDLKVVYKLEEHGDYSFLILFKK